MRRLLSVDRDAATWLLNAPRDGRKWTVSALAGQASAQGKPWGLQWSAFIDRLFWPGHCAEAYADTMAGRPLELHTWRARRGALRALLATATGGGLP